MTVPPVAKTVPFTRSHHGDDVSDPYAWLADRSDPDTVAYLKAENEYTTAMTARLQPLAGVIFTEIKDRTQETDLSVPHAKDGWWYYSRTETGRQYPIHCRLPAWRQAPPVLVPGVALDGEYVLLDGNELAMGHDFFRLGTVEVSPDGWRLAYSVDTTGDERYTLRIKDLKTGDTLADEIPGTFYGSAWSLDSQVLFYTTVDDSWRPSRVWRHRVGSDATEDVTVFTESDEKFWVEIAATRSKEFVEIVSASNITSEVRLIDATRPAEAAVMVRERVEGVEYEVDHQRGGRLVIVHNDPKSGGGPNFAVATASMAQPAAWTPLIEHSEDVRISGADVFCRHLVLDIRENGLTGIRIYPFAGDGTLGGARDVSFDEPVYTVHPGVNAEYDTASFRLEFTSLVTPRTVYDYGLDSGELLLRKRDAVLGGYDPADYEQRREWATAPDGTRIPMSLVFRRGTPTDSSVPAVIYGYGSYESSSDPVFSVWRLSLLQRGVVYAVAHVRGGGEMGRSWYTDGKLTRKKNTFTDFVSCARHLVDAGFTSADRLVAEGGSAGGLLMGAAANLAPDAFAGIVAAVPFVDALTTILDPSLPLTVTEWDEWGDPLHDPEVYEYMKSYTPYENLRRTDYPAILAETSLNDTRVYYTEPAKWVARLRTVNTGQRPVLLKTEMEAGHGGRSGRYDAWRQRAFRLAFELDTVGAAGELTYSELR